MLSTSQMITQVLLNLESNRWEVRQGAVNIISVLSKQDIMRIAVIPKMETIIRMMVDSDSDVRESASMAVAGLLNDKKIGFTDAVPHAITDFTTMIQNMIQGSQKRDSAMIMMALGVLAQHKNIRSELINLDIIPNLSSMLKSEMSVWEPTTLRALTPLLNHDDVRLHLPMDHIMRKMTVMVKESESHGREIACSTIIDLLQYNDVTGLFSKPDMMQNIASILGDSQIHVREALRPVLTKLLSDHHFRQALSKPEAANMLISMLKDNTAEIRRGTLDAIVIFNEYDYVQSWSRSADIVLAVVLELEDIDLDVKEHALEAVLKLSKRSHLLQHMSTPETMHKILPLLHNVRPHVRALAIETMVLFVNEDEMIKVISKPQIMEQFTALLGDEDGQLVGMLDGDGDEHILKFVDTLVKLAAGNLMIGGSLIRQPLKRMDADISAQLLESYTALVLKLPPSFAISTADIGELIALLHSTNLATLRSALTIVGHFVENPQFCQHILKSNIWAILLQRKETANMIPEFLEKFAQHGLKTSAAKIRLPSESGIVPQLLDMLDMQPDVFDVDRWESGLKGLLALGIL
ncbi:armadillo-type protein [Mycena galopus ATCC 62051]|nr:armadillo-type protein [Mycena galopus ATCC 62051]